MDVQSEANSDDGQGGDGEGDQRKLANRACDFCHRMKMKCIGKETPPCNRCRQAGHRCTFDGPRKSKTSKVEDRLRFVEVQMGDMQSAIHELLNLQRAAAAGPSRFPMEAQTQSPFRAPPTESYTTPQTLLSLEGFFEPPPTNPDPSPRFHTPNDMLFTQNPPSNNPSINIPNPVWHPPPKSSPPILPIRPIMPTLASSVLGSDDDEDADPYHHGVGPWDNMFSLAEAARLKQDGHAKHDPNHPFDFTTGQTKKKRRLTKGAAKGEEESFLEMKRNLPLQRGNHSHGYQDPIELGWCTLEQGRHAFDLFMENSLVYMPCLDPEVDTFESLRKRSPFCITAILFTAAKITDASGPVSDLQRKCREYAEKMGMSTLFTPVARLEAVQALIILASWGDTSWRPGGHATRIAMDMGLYQCMPILACSGMGKGKKVEELREDWALVAGARVWLTLYKMEMEMAFNLGRPALFGAEETIRHSRDLLTHPLSIQTDQRLAATCELLTIRISLHQPFTLTPQASAIPDLDERLQTSEDASKAWYEHWDGRYEKLGLPKGHFLRESLITSRCSADMHCNSRILHGVRNKRDVAQMSETRRQRLVRAMKAAEALMGMCLRSQQYSKNFRYANLYTHVNIAFAARFLIRATSLLPEAVNCRQIGREVEKVANLLTQVPGFTFATFLHDVILRARRHNVLPPPSKPPSPTHGPHPPLPPISQLNQSQPQFPSPHSSTGGGSTSGMLDFGLNAFDFGYADHLFSGTGGGGGVGGNLVNGGGTGPGYGFDNQSTEGYVDGNYNLDAWFPFPPLENEGTSQTLVPRPSNIGYNDGGAGAAGWRW